MNTKTTHFKIHEPQCSFSVQRNMGKTSFFCLFFSRGFGSIELLQQPRIQYNLLHIWLHLDVIHTDHSCSRPAVSYHYWVFLFSSSAVAATCPRSCSSLIIALIIYRGQIIHVAPVLLFILSFTLYLSGFVYLVWLPSDQLQTVWLSPALPPSSAFEGHSLSLSLIVQHSKVQSHWQKGRSSFL